MRQLASALPIRGAAMIIVALFTAMAVGPAFATHGGDSADVVYFGTDKSFSNTQMSIYQCTGGTCTVSTSSGWVKAEASSLEGGSMERGALVGISYPVEKRCDGQDVRATFVQALSFTYDIAAASAGAGASTASISVVTEDPTVGEVVTPFQTVQNAGRITDSQVPGVWTSAPIDLSGVLEAASNATFTTKLRVDASASSQDFTIEKDSADAAAETRFSSLQVIFGDETFPISSIDLTSTATPKGGSSAPVLFDGWYNAPVTATVSADDPATVDGLVVASSCVHEIEIEDNGAPMFVHPPGYNRQPWVKHALDDGRYRLSARATDYAGNAEPTSLVKEFGVDTLAPLTQAEINRAPNGRDGWYKIPAAGEENHHYTVTCSDLNGQTDVGEVSGCSKIQHRFRTTDGWTTMVANPSQTVTISTSGSGLVFAHRADDVATNLETIREEPVINVDLIAPPVNKVGTGASIFGNGWYNTPDHVVRVECLNDAPSGCDVAQDDEIGRCDVEKGIQTVAWTIEDLAGNTASGSEKFGCDFVAPPRVPSMFVCSTTNEVDGKLYGSALPKWCWNGVTDPVLASGEAPSGTKHYELTAGGVTYTINHVDNQSSYSFQLPSSVSDGRKCPSVVAVDDAGNRAPARTSTCITLDRLAPLAVYLKPKQFSLYLGDREIGLNPNQPLLNNGLAVIVGPLHFNVTGDDRPRNGVESGVYHVDYWAEQNEAGDPGFPMSECFISTDLTPCAWDNPRSIATQEFATYPMKAQVWDRALNTHVANHKFLNVHVAAVNRACDEHTNLCESETVWTPYVGAGFVRYLICQSDVAPTVQTPCDLTTAAEITTQSTSSYVNNVQKGSTKYVTVLTVTAMGTTTSHAARLFYDSDTLWYVSEALQL